MPWRVLISRMIDAEVLAQFRQGFDVEVWENPQQDNLGMALARFDAVVSMPGQKLDRQTLAQAQAGQLKIVAQHAVGLDNIDLKAAQELGLWVSHTPDVLTEATAEFAWSLAFSLARNLSWGERMLRQGQWQGWAPTQWLGQSLVGCTVGIVGAGRIGQAFARLGQGFRCKYLYTARQRKPEFEAELDAEYRELDDLLAEADLISLHVPGGEDTHHLMDAQRLKLLKPSALLVNTGRGTLIDEAALVEALKQGQLAGAGLDVYEKEPQVHSGLLELPNVVLAPHLGSATVETRRKMALMCLENIQALERGDRPPQAAF